jgi:hypothetical protein
VPTLKYLKKNELMAIEMLKTAIAAPFLLDQIESASASAIFGHDALSDGGCLVK